jgi:hypothetical protein
MSESAQTAPRASGDEGAPPSAEHASAAAAQEAQLRAAYEEQLRQLTSADLLLQSAASLVNLGARRLGLASGEPAERDLGQARDAIDGVRSLMPVLERCLSAAQLGPLRDALSQLQLAFAREAPAAGAPAAGASAAGAPAAGAPAPAAGTPAPGAEPSVGREPARPPGGPPPREPAHGRRPGPAEASGRLWVPGRS